MGRNEGAPGDRLALFSAAASPSSRWAGGEDSPSCSRNEHAAPLGFFLSGWLFSINMTLLRNFEMSRDQFDDSVFTSQEPRSACSICSNKRHPFVPTRWP